MKRIAERMNGLGTETAFEVLARARKIEATGKEVIHLEIGEPDFDTPSNVIAAGVSAMQSGWTHYGPSAGLPEAREAIAETFSNDRGVPVDADRIVITPGAKPILFYSVLALVNPGDEVIYPDPGFPIYESVISFFGARPVPLPLREDREFTFDIADLEARITDRTRMLIINSPHNPCGSMLSSSDLEAIAQLAEKHDFWVLADEVYSRIVYEEPHDSIIRFPGMADRTIVVEGYSKTYAMTGWRLGYGVMPQDLVPHLARLMTNSNSCTASFTQLAGIEALRGPQDEAEAMVAEFRRRRDRIVEGLNAIPGITCVKPKGAFYVFPNITGTGVPASELQHRLLEEAGVAALAGTSFGPEGEGYLRLSYANSLENIDKALDKMAGLLQGV
ncbi:MAG: pyridoxal phosphate-dependent aminotransferase [Gemmatimonadota bacterium]|jgi:aspartate/methionine/tyrosine aminotransferase|nr:aspartate aminotransferase [Gemmatimonadota bacterium]MDP6528212.1 pyridoxal phosphate-dependent aminotransferase [Gemmatimonadota bacterium]MDP6803591.1 pyridoxal phosphate-dependent aminotransferase [Gemmatimonadota bacterium]MDP7031854.1 pyridoxal phosphate-dependent aminotransferase [Gemmatimonadota bacterium]